MNSIINRTQGAETLLEMDSGELGERIYHNVASEYSGDVVEIGEDFQETIRKAKNGEIDALEAVEKTLIAISGSGFSSTAGTN